MNLAHVLGQLGQTSLKLDAFSEGFSQTVVTILPLVVVSKNTNMFLLIVHDTIVFQNLLYKIRFSTLARTHDQ